MPNLQALYSSLGEYKRFQGELEDMVTRLKTVLETLSSASRNIQDTFQYDDFSADNKNIEKNRDKVNTIIISLEKEIIPEIERKIVLLNRQIADAEMAQTLSANGF